MDTIELFISGFGGASRKDLRFGLSPAILRRLRNVRSVPSSFDVSPLPPEPYPIPLRLSPKLLILAFAFLQQDDIMHIVAQKDLQRTTIYSEDAHEMSFR
jgi:hypothetical protein